MMAAPSMSMRRDGPIHQDRTVPLLPVRSPPIMSYDTLSRSVVFVVTLVVLLVGHSLGDHVAQTDRQATRKADRGAAGWRALAGHLLAYHVTITVALLLTCAALRLPLSMTGVVAGVAFSAVTHGLLDRRWPV